MTCKTCAHARETQGLWATHDPACIYCGARLIHRIAGYAIGRAEVTERRKEHLATWVAQGHPEAAIRALVKDGPFFEPLAKKLNSAKNNGLF